MDSGLLMGEQLAARLKARETVEVVPVLPRLFASQKGGVT